MHDTCIISIFGIHHLTYLQYGMAMLARAREPRPFGAPAQHVRIRPRKVLQNSPGFSNFTCMSL